MTDSNQASRRRFLGYTGMAGFSTLVAQAIGVDLGLVTVAGAQSGRAKVQPFTFAIISDSHLYSIPDHKFDRSLEDAVAQVNALSPAPDFVVYGGDIAQNGTEDQLVKGKKILLEAEDADEGHPRRARLVSRHGHRVARAYSVRTPGR